MIAVAGKLWCAGENEVIVLSPNLISIEVIFSCFKSLLDVFT
jgi:hypothetical protein